jgi:hypothetical protein
MILIRIVDLMTMLLWFLDIVNFSFMKPLDDDIPLNTIGWIVIFFVLIWAKASYDNRSIE